MTTSGSYSLKDGANVPVISVGYDNRSRLQYAESMNMITTNIIHQMYNDKDRAKAESFYTKMNNEIVDSHSTSGVLVNKLNQGNFQYFDTLADYIDDSITKTNEKSIPVKRDLIAQPLPIVDLDDTYYIKNGDLNNETLGDFEVPLIAPIKNLEGSPYDKFKPTVNGYKDMDRGFLLNTHRPIYANNGSVGHSFKIHPRNSKSARVYS
jgi:hypothetical protein